MMKKTIIVIGMAFAVLLSACSDWVNVSPKEEVEADKLFSSENGFKSALIGAYARMTLTENYGETLSYGFIEQLVQRYDNYDPSMAPTDARRAERYNYKTNASAKGYVNNVWRELFLTIANLNSLLRHLENGGREVVLTEGLWEQMKGEALGLRAFHYFDLLRLYGPVYSEDPDMKCLPWRAEFNADRKDLLPASEIVAHILDDLKVAERLLAGDNLENNRQHRMNLFAVKGLMARVYLWINDKENAATKAKEVIDGCGLELVTNNGQDVAMFGETLFALGMDDMEEKLRSDWADLTTYSGELYISSENAETVFEATRGIGLNDIRYRNGYGFIFGTNGRMCRKYLGSDILYKEKIPLIRLSEMYYILAESVDLPESVSYINRVRNVRGISKANNYQANDAYDEDARIEALNLEYSKDFFAEGQYFYFLKRHNRQTFYRCPVIEMQPYYVLPTPDDEIAYGSGND
ncbi:MAG: RagB/SusD family nutrient uptake outer membrane protein [Odoribacter sp.]|nr:RagB/SusD family nutrient uptake outer membrane protein [Odoribacter sp.]